MSLNGKREREGQGLSGGCGYGFLTIKLFANSDAMESDEAKEDWLLQCRCSDVIIR